MIVQATEREIPVIEEILGDVVDWMEREGIPNLWNRTNIRWEKLSKNYCIQDFYILYEEEEPIACMAITDVDQTYWPDVSKGEAFYLHKLAVKRAYAGNGVSKKMVTYAKELVRMKNKETLRLDCNADRLKLRALYENYGFHLVKEIKTKAGYPIALYNCDVSVA
ncbi:GNAT family N-acetyltransferase [Anaerosporobacter faecicola]|uniref:GNAT family N-acetyltransferase n=1 Tax=Anaerosporobacter faecicola TaxID=2718714 RepID=UPI0014387B4A|nr:GNAT family N-acetyltransferase [Anaerosporobacter faecicola]